MVRFAKDIADTQDMQPDGREELTVEKVLKDFKCAHEAKKKFLATAREDYEFWLGKQWDDADVAKLEKVGVRAMTINKIAAHIQLMKGIESQNRSDFHAFPEGTEDELSSEIATRLMKNAVKNSDLDFKTSELFEDGNVCGEAFLEPWVKYPYRQRPDGTTDMNGELCWKKNYYDCLFPDPASREYDYSDAGYFCKFTADLTMNQLIEMFPDKKDEIEAMEKNGGKIDLDRVALDRDGLGIEIQKKGYKDDSKSNPWVPKKGFDLLDYYYKRYVEKFYVADFTLKKVRLCADEKEADRYVSKVKRDDEKQAKRINRAPAKTPLAQKITRLQPEMWVAFITGMDSEDFLAHGPAWSFPRWNGYPFFGYSCFKSSAPVAAGERDFLVQGITRRAKDLNRHLNKRATQELRHLNQSANSGWTGEEGSFVDKDKWENFGSAPGIVLEHAAGQPAPAKILPTPLSQGHAQLVQEYSQHIRDVIGVNPETLAIEADQSSGRAIALRQKQGMVMVQGQFDNLARTRRAIGRFILAILPDVFDVEKAMRVLGDAFLQQNFQSPVVDPATGQPAIDPQTGQPVTQYDPNLAAQTVNGILSDVDLGLYDVAVGENISTETVAMANYLQLMDMAKQGYPIPPDVMYEESTLSEATKKKLIAYAQAQMAASAGAPPPKK